MPQLRLLILEDRAADAELMLHELVRAGFEPEWQRAETESEFLAHLSLSLDLILADASLSRLKVERALELLRDRALDIPFIITSGTLGEEMATSLIRQGVTDYVLKSQLTRLGPAVARALEARQLRARRAQAEQALRESELRFRLLAENARDLISLVDTEGRYVYMSPSHTQVLGYSGDDLLRRNILDLMHPEDRAGLANWQDAPTLEFRIRRVDGEWVPLEGSSYLIISRGGPLIAMILRDITERTQSQRELQRRASEFAALYETTRDLAAQHNLPSLLQTIVERAISLLRTSGGGIYLYDEERGDLAFHAVEGSRDAPLGQRVSLGSGIAGRVAKTRQPMVVDDDHHSEYRPPEHIAAVMAAPMLYGGELLGVLVVHEYETTGHRFTEAERQLLEFFAAQAAIALHNAELFQQVHASRRRLQLLSRQLLQAQEVERRNIARELHDEIGQTLTSVQMNLQAIEPELAQSPARTRLQETMATLEQTLQQVRSLSLNLRPSVLDDFGLVPALNWLARRQAQAIGLSVEFSADPLTERPPVEVETACFRVAQEALTNVIRHAHAKRVLIDLKQVSSELQLSIQDDGVGFDLPAVMRRARNGASLGLLGLKERVLLAGGQIDIESAPGEGTLVRASFPLNPSESFVERRQHRRK